MKIGTTLLCCDDSVPFILASCSWHAAMFYRIALILHRPCKTLLHLCKHVECMYPGIYLCAIVNEEYSEDAKTRWCNYALRDLIRRGCDVITNLDDDEFYIQNVSVVIEAVRQKYADFADRVLYQFGYCFYQTYVDKKDFNPVRRMVYRDDSSVDYEFKKWICPSILFNSTTNGNHFVTTIRPVLNGIVDKLVVYHYTYRQKILNKHDYHPLTADEIKGKNLVCDESLIKLFEEYSVIV